MELIYNPKIAAKREMQKSIAMQKQEDLAAIASTISGQRFFADTLKSLGMGRPLNCDEGDIALHNHAIRLFYQLSEVCPNAAQNILAAVFGI